MIRLKSLLSEQENARPIDNTKLNLTYLITGITAALSYAGFAVWAKLIRRRNNRLFTDAVSKAIQDNLTSEQWPYIRRGEGIAEILRQKIQSIPKDSTDATAMADAILNGLMEFIVKKLDVARKIIKLKSEQDTALRAALTPIISEWAKANLTQQ